MHETFLIEGREFPRHPSYQFAKMTDKQRLNLMFQAVNYARTHCTTRERPLHLSLCRAEGTIASALERLGPTPSPRDAEPDWMARESLPFPSPVTPPLGNGASMVVKRS